MFKLSAAIIRSRCRQVARTPDQYDFGGRLQTCEQHSALCNLFSRLSPNDEKDLLVGALAVYGWMPRMFRDLAARDMLKKLLADLSLGSRLN